MRGEQRARDHQGRGRKDASRATGIEAAEADPSRPLTLLDQQSGDQEPGKDEEDIDTDEAGLGAGDPDMAEEDEQDRDPAESLQVRSEPIIARSRVQTHGCAGRSWRLCRSRAGWPGRGGVRIRVGPGPEARATTIRPTAIVVMTRCMKCASDGLLTVFGRETSGPLAWYAQNLSACRQSARSLGNFSRRCAHRDRAPGAGRPPRIKRRPSGLTLGTTMTAFASNGTR